MNAPRCRLYPRDIYNRPRADCVNKADGGTVGEHQEHPHGTILAGRYELLQPIGQGGMSTVYLARDLHFPHVERRCAIKALVSHNAHPRTRALQRAAFEREAALLATLRHPAIPQVFDFFTIDDVSYLVLEYVEGENLEHYVARLPGLPSEAQLIDWALQLLDVLSYLHNQKPEPIIFRDLKPSNIMRRPDGSLCLIDFGIARIFQPQHRGTMIGTEGYAPPEQYRGIVDPRADLYALGATLYHLATRIDPRDEPPFSLVYRPPRQMNPNLSEQFEAVILRALAYRPEDRFPSAAAMAEAIRACRTPAVTPSAPIKAAHSQDLQPSVCEEEQPDTRVLWTVATGDEVRGSACIAQDTVFIGSYDRCLYAIALESGQVLWRYRAGRGIVSRPVVSHDTVIVGAEDGNVYALDCQTGALRWRYLTPLPIRSSPALAADTGVVIIGGDDGMCYALDALTGTLLWRRHTRGPIRASPLLAQSRVLAASEDRTVYAWSLTSGEECWRCQLDAPILASPTLAADLVLVATLGGKLWAIVLETGAVHWQITLGPPIVATPLVWGETVIVGVSDGTLWAGHTGDGTFLWQAKLGSQITGAPNADDALGYVGTVDGRFVAFTADGSIRWTYEVNAPIVSRPALAPHAVIFGAFDGRVYALRR